MTTPNIFISHRWAFDDYEKLVAKFKEYNLCRTKQKESKSHAIFPEAFIPVA